MKGIIGGTSQIYLSGSVRPVKETMYERGLIKSRLRRVYPEADQRVLDVVVDQLVKRSSHRGDDTRFRSHVKEELLRSAQGIFPDRGYTEKNDYSILYTAIADFIKDRDAKIKAYRGNK